METVQLIIHDVPYAAALRDLLQRNSSCDVRCVEVPDPKHEGVIVVDSDGLDRLPAPLPNPEHVVLITTNDPEHLAKAWNAGIRSVVFNEDPLSTAVLAIMAAELRVPKTDPRWAVSHPPPRSAGSGARAGCGQAPGAEPPITVLEPNVPSSKSRDREGLK